MATISIQIAGHDERFIQEAVNSGRYHDESDVIAEALADLQAREKDLQARVARMHAQVAEGFTQLEGGEVGNLDLEQVKRDGRQRFAERQSQRT